MTQGIHSPITKGVIVRMSGWMISEIVRAGGVDTTFPGEDLQGHFRATYQGYFIWMTWEKINVARADDFDRWANSRVYEGPAPNSLERLDQILRWCDSRQRADQVGGAR
jgi:hypothetical protein